MGYEELKELVIRNLKEDSNYLVEQIDILDSNLALIQVCDLELSEIQKKELIILDWLIKIKEELNDNAEPTIKDKMGEQVDKGYVPSKKVVKND